MARINGIVPGLMPQATAAHIAEQAKPKVKRIKEPNEIRCECCDGLIGFNVSRKVHTSPCRHCRNMFGHDGFNGQTKDSASDALKKMSELREQGWAMILRLGSYGSPAGGSVMVEPGDVFQVKRAGSGTRLDVREPVSYERTRSLFTAEIDIGPHVLTLFSHEVSAIALVTIMELKAKGELTEQYVSADDKTGHFAPSDAMREQIYELFGRLTGEPT